MVGPGGLTPGQVTLPQQFATAPTAQTSAALTIDPRTTASTPPTTAQQPIGQRPLLPRDIIVDPLPVAPEDPVVPTDPYEKYRKNVEVFPETGAFKNPQLQGKFDTMVKEVGRKGATRTQKSAKIVDYLKAIYQGPAYLKETGVKGANANRFTDEFKEFARSLNIKIHGTANQELSVGAGNPILTIPGFLPAKPKPPGIADATLQRMYQPGLPVGGTVQAAMTPGAREQLVDPRTGQLRGGVSVGTAMADARGATVEGDMSPSEIQAQKATPGIDAALDRTVGETTELSQDAQVTAQQQVASSVSALKAEQGEAILIDNPVQREIQEGELVSGGAANAQTAASFTEQIEAAQATPSAQATVQGQLAQLTANFDASNPPAWAAGSLRAATQQMAARGLGASSIAGQAILQATLEAALPIAQADASIIAQFEQQNLSNRQQRAMLSAQQRAQFIGQEFDQAFQVRVQNAAKIGDIANMNFTAEQQIQLENSRAANTIELNNLSNRQAMVIAEASALANLDLSNLNNRQQAAVQNAQSFLNVDMANLSNKQQTELFKAQQRVQSLFTDTAAENAARQFNASSEQQTKQFFANLATQVSQFNATQANSQSQFNVGQRNTLERFNAELNNQREQFNAQNQMVIAQSNAQWRREIATADTAAVNRANELNAAAILDVNKTAYDNLWNYYADTMEWAWTSAENEQNRIADMAIAALNADERAKIAAEQSKTAAGKALGGLIGTLGSAFIGAKFG